ncbi:MAG: zinc-dependent metalloprotease [Nitrospira sp.]|nr:zinc-dependent metalloprotease [Nitrospira sp.]
MEPTLPFRQTSRSHRTPRRLFIRSHTIVLCLCAIALGVPAVGICASTPSQPPLLIETPSDIPPAIAQAFPSPQMAKRWVRRHRTMALNPTALDAMRQARKEKKAAVTLDLFEAGTRTLEFDEPQTHRNKVKVWHGRLQGDSESDVTLAMRGRKMVGTIYSNQRLYKIEPTEDNRHRLVEIDEEALPLDHHPLVVPDDGTPADIPTQEPNLEQLDTAAAATTGAVTTAAATTPNTIVDLLVVYTSTARARQGGQAAMNALVALGVDLANQAYSNSGIAMRLRLARAAEIAYTESGNISTDLTRLRSTTDGFVDQVHQLRNQYKADLVALIVDNGGGYCGIAYVMANGPRASFANYAFSVTDRECVANNTLTHELGHNMGNAHDRASGGTGVFAYSYGYRDTVGKFRTIMAYPCPTVSCPRVKYFSNPKIKINGRPAGIDHRINPMNSADNARSMNEVRNIIAAWRTGTSTSAATSPNILRNSRSNSPTDSPNDVGDESDDEFDDESDDDSLDEPRTDSHEKSRGKSRLPLP